MSEQYFQKNPDSLSQQSEIEVEFKGEIFHFLTDHGVFSRKRFDYGSRVLLQYALEELEGDVLDFGCGYGPIGLIASHFKSKLNLTMIDINERAIDLAKVNAKRQGIEAKIFQSDGFENIEENYDHILMNPPIRLGKKAIFTFFKKAREYLKPGGKLYVVIQKKQGAKSVKDFLKGSFDEVKILGKSAGFQVYCAIKEETCQ